MIERILIIVILALVGSGAYTAFKTFHMKRLGGLNNESKLLLLYFRSDQCAPCVTQARYLEQLEKKWNGDLIVQKIDTDIEPDKAHQYGVFTLPTTILVDNVGQIRQINYGLTNTQKLSQQCSQIVL
jgi:thioredoxin-like negative regulator of GroEL